MERVMVQITVFSAVSFLRRMVWGWRERDEYGSIDHDMLTFTVSTYNIGVFRYVFNLPTLAADLVPSAGRLLAAAVSYVLLEIGPRFVYQIIGQRDTA